MRIKSFMQFEKWRQDVPEDFIHLTRMDYYLDPKDGHVYQTYSGEHKWNDGVPNYDYRTNDFEQLKRNVTPEELKQVEAAWRSCEELVRPLIDWSLVDDIRQVSLAEEITDRGHQVLITLRDGEETLYTEWFDKGVVKWQRLWRNDYEKFVEGLDGLGDRIIYEVRVMMSLDSGWGWITAEEPFDGFVDRVKSLHPGMEDRIVYADDTLYIMNSMI